MLLGLGAGALSLALLALGLRLVLPESQSLLEATRDLPPGATIQPDDVIAVDVQVPPSVTRASFPSEAIDQVVGRRLGTRVAAGQLLAPSQLQDSHTTVAPGRVQDYRWMFDADPQVGLFLRSDYRRRHRDARLKLADLLATGPESGLNRAEELYSGLCAEEPDNEQLWTALFRIHERTGSILGLESGVRRLRAALVELGASGARLPQGGRPRLVRRHRTPAPDLGGPGDRASRPGGADRRPGLLRDRPPGAAPDPPGARPSAGGRVPLRGAPDRPGCLRRLRPDRRG